MKIIPDNSRESITEKGQIEQVQEKKNELKYLGALKKVKGHTLFSFNRETGEIKPAEFRREVILDIYGRPKYKEQVLVERFCYYEQALNKKNFIKRLIRKGIYFEKQQGHEKL